MTPEERSRVLALVVAPGRRRPVAPEEFLRCFGVSDGVVLGLDLLRDAIERRDPVDVELALIVCFTFGFSGDHLEPLVKLAFANWHERHEDVATALGRIGSPGSVDALVHLAEWVPAYLEFDDARALATKAISALGSIGGDEAYQALESLSGSTSDVVAETARAQIERSVDRGP
jgi:hypothetical protein